MTKPKSKPDSHSRRYQRYRDIVNIVTQQTAFSVANIKRLCQDERPAFVSKVIQELASDGWLVAIESEPSGDSAHVVKETGSPSESDYQWNQGKGTFQSQRWIDDRLFGVQITTSPEQERPRERLLAVGAEQLKLSELLAILIRSGRPGESAVMAAEKLARQYADRLGELPGAGRGELKSLSVAIEKTAYCQIMAGIELGRRIAAASESRQRQRITSSADAKAFCQRRFSRLATDAVQEEFHIVTLSTKNEVIDTHQITVGTLDASLVHPREVFRPAIKDAASSMLLVHNHPSGDPSPSPEDIAVTKRLQSAAEIIGIDVLDHIVLGNPNAVSLKDTGRV